MSTAARMRFSHQRNVSQSLHEYGRGIAGGILFSLPLLFTMEVWWAGFLLHPLRLIAYMLASFGVLLLYNRFAGLHQDASFGEVVIDSIEEMGIGLLIAAAVLFLLDRFDAEMHWPEMAGMIVMEGMTVAIGVSIGTAQLGNPDGPENGMSDDEENKRSGYLQRVAIAFCGAILIASNIAPTDEVTLLAMEMSAWGLVGTAVLSLGLGGFVLHFANFHRDSGRQPPSDFHAVVSTYAAALAAAAASLYFFGRYDGHPPFLCLGQTVVLSLPAVMGASAGRMLILSPSRST